MRQWFLMLATLTTLSACGAHIKMPVYRATSSDSPPDQFAYVLNELTVKGTLYEQDVVILDSDVKTTMKPPAAEWLREAVVTEFGMAGLVASNDQEAGLPKVDIVIEQFFAEQVNNFFLFVVLSDQAAITMIRITVTSPDDSVTYDRRFVGHLEDINQFRYIYPVFFMAASYDLGDMLHKTAQQALSEAASETRLLFEQGSIR